MQIGTRLGPYEILAPLKTGGMDEVWRASDTRLDRVVALKVLSEAFVKDVGSHPIWTRTEQREAMRSRGLLTTPSSSTPSC